MENDISSFTNSISKYCCEYEYQIKDLNDNEIEDFNNYILQSWDKSLFLFNRIDQVQEGFFLLKRITKLRQNLLDMGFSLPMATHITLKFNLNIFIKKYDAILDLSPEELVLNGDNNNEINKAKAKLIESSIKMKFTDVDFSTVHSYFDTIENYLSLKKIESNKKINVSCVITLNSFFINSVSEKSIKLIQTTFCNYKGKQMAILIYLLQKEFKLTEIISGSTTHSREHFVKNLKNDFSFNKMSGINKYIDPFSEDLTFSITKTIPPIFLQIRKKLTEIL